MTQLKGTWLAVLLILFALVIYTWGTWQYFTKPIPGGNDFMAHYTAWEAFFKFGHSPYSEEAALYTQNAIYGRPVVAGEDQNRLTYPFYSALVHAPFIFVDYALARSIYMILLQVAIVVGIIMMMDVLKWRPPVWLLASILLWALLFYPQSRGVILGQFAAFGFFFLAVCLFLLKRDRDFWAGVILALSTIKPTLVFLVVPYFVIWSIARRRWNFVWGLVISLAILILASFLILPTWMGEWVERMFRYSGYTVGQSPVWLLTHLAMPQLGTVGEIIIVVLIMAGLFWAWWLVFRPGGEYWFLWSLGLPWWCQI